MIHKQSCFSLFCRLFLGISLPLLWVLSGCGQSESTPPADQPGSSVEQGTPSVAVQTQALRIGTMEETIKTYGRVAPLPGHIQLTTVSYEASVRNIMVAEGQAVSAGQPLIEVTPSPAAQLALEQAELEQESATKNMALVKDRLDLKLATQQELLVEQQRLDLATQRLSNLRAKGLDGSNRIIKADSDGVIWQIRVQPGEMIPAGQTMIAMVPQGQAGVILGVEPEDIDHVHVGQPVRIKQINSAGGQMIPGKVSLVTHQINPSTRLIDIVVKPETMQPGILLNESVSGQIVLSSKETLIAPRAAVLPDDQGYHLFTVVDGLAVRHEVRIGLENHESMQVISDSLREGMRVIVVGNYGLADGMAVREEAKP